MATQAGVSLEELVLLNMAYEANGGCTTLLTPVALKKQEEDGNDAAAAAAAASNSTSSSPSATDFIMLMGRTLDWQQPLLRDLSLELSVMRDGALLYRATSFAGFLGVFTGHKPDRYAVAVNFRCAHGEDEDDEDDEDEEMEQEEEDDGAFNWPIGMLVRHVLESRDSYSAALEALSSTPLMSQSYFILCGLRQGAVVTRNPRGCVRTMHIDGDKVWEEKGDEDEAEEEAEDAQPQRPVGIRTRSSTAAAAVQSHSSKVHPLLPSASSSAPLSSPYLAQANLDHWLRLRKHDFQESLPRTSLVQRHFQQMAPGAATEQDVWSLLSTHPIWDEETIYATLAAPAADLYINRLQRPVEVEGPQTSARKTTPTASKHGRRRRKR